MGKVSKIREHFILPMDNPIAIENIRRNVSPAESHSNLLTSEELDILWKYCFRTENQVRMNRNGTVLVTGEFGNLRPVFEKLESVKNKILNIIGKSAENSPAIGGNWFITPQQYGLHNDSIRHEDFEGTIENTPLDSSLRKYTVWKNVLIPLWIGTHFDFEDGGQLLFYEQRHIDWATVYNAGNVTPNIASVYKICTDYTELQFHDKYGNPISRNKNNLPFNKEHFDKFVNAPYERMQGLSLESVFNWNPGTIFVFDAVQLHSSNQGKKSRKIKSWNSKMGLLLTFLKELDKDLLEDWRKYQSDL